MTMICWKRHRLILTLRTSSTKTMTDSWRTSHRRRYLRLLKTKPHNPHEQRLHLSTDRQTSNRCLQSNSSLEYQVRRSLIRTLTVGPPELRLQDYTTFTTSNLRHISSPHSRNDQRCFNSRVMHRVLQTRQRVDISHLTIFRWKLSNLGGGRSSLLNSQLLRRLQVPHR